MENKYNYLKKYMYYNYEKGVPIPYLANFFRYETEDEIKEGERILGHSFPNELREFYQEIGSGYLTTPHNPPPDHSFFGSNEILPPITAAKFATGQLIWEGQEHWMAEDEYEVLKKGELPFFEMYNSSHFLKLRLNSNNPNAVWFYDIKIEDSFERFIWRLYYESPIYYGDIIEAHTAKKK